MDKQEKIVCAAVKFEQPVPGSSECIVIGIDYKDCESKDRFYELKANDDFLNLKWKKTSGYQNGFITSKKRFVDAKEAMQIAMKMKQIRYLNLIEKEYNLEVIKNRGVSEQANVLFKLLEHQKSIYEGGCLKPDDLY